MKKILKRLKLRTWIGLVLIGILAPIAILRLAYIIAAPPSSTAYWKFDEAQGTTINDATNNSNTGTSSGATWRDEGSCAFGNCMFYDGTQDFISTVADDDDFDFAAANSFTFSFWFRHAPKAAGTEMLVAKHNATAGGYKIYMESDGDITCGIDDDSSFGPEDSVTSTEGTYDDNQWHYVACVKNGTTSLTLYIDGASVGTPDTSFTATGTLANADIFYFGMDGDGTSNDYTGFLDEFKMYRSTLTASQINIDLNRGAAERFEPVPANFLTKGLVGHWEMDETSWSVDCLTGSVIDSSGNSNTGRACPDTTGPAGGAAGKFGYSGLFDGSNDNVEISDATSLDLATNITAAAWVKSTNSDATADVIVAKWTGGGSQNYWLGKLDATTLYFQVNAGEAVSTTLSPVNDGGWHHVAGIADAGQKTLTLYIDGVQKASATYTGTSQTGTSTLQIGQSPDAAGQVWNGNIDDVRVYNRALSSGEMRALYNSAPTPVGYWKMDEATGTSATDSSGNENTLTLTNTPTWTTGKYGAGINLAGSDQHLTRADDADFDFIDDADMTFSTFFKHDTASAQEIIMSKYQEAGYKMIMESDGDITCALDYDSTWTPTDAATSTAATYDDNQWHHVSCVKLGATSLSLYIDGVLIATDSSLTAANALTNADPLYIGVDADGSSNDFVGQLDEVKIYNYARSSSQVTEDLNAGHPLGGSPISSQLIYWNFDEGYGTTANNNGTATSSNGTLTNIATPATSSSGWTFNGKINKAIIFNGADTDDQVALATASDAAVDFNGTESFSISAWVYPTGVPTSATDEDLIVGKWDESNSLRAYRIFLENDDTDSTGNIRVEVMDESTAGNEILSVTGANDSISENTWYHVAFTFNGGVAGAASDLNLYVNSQHIGGNSANTSFLGIDDVASDFTVGDYDTNDSDTDLDAFTGRIDEIKVYGSALSADNIKIDRNGGGASTYGYVQSSQDEASQLSSGAGNPPIGYWPMDENTGTSTTADKSGNDNAGTLTNIEATDWTQAKVGAGLRLDGVSELVSVADSAALDATSGVTTMGWVNVTTAGINQQDTITYDTTASTTAANTNQATFDITVASNSNRMLVLGVSTEDTEETELVVSSADFNGDAMSLAVARNQAATTDRNAELWYLAAPDTGTHTVTVNFAGTTTSIAVGAISLYNVAQEAPEAVGSGGSANNTATTIQVITETNNAWVVDAVINGATGDFTAGTDQVERWDQTAGGHQGASSTKPVATAGSTDMTQTNTGSSGMSHVGASFAPSSTVADAIVIGKGSDAYNLTLSSALTLTATINTSNTTTATLTTGWHHVAMTYDGTNLKIFIDGIQQNSAAVTGTINTNTTALTIAQYINGVIDDVKVYNYGRSQEQIAYDYNRGRPNGWWKFDEGSGSTANDSSDNGNAGAITEAAYASGKYNDSLDFDGTNDVVTVTNANAIDFDFGLKNSVSFSAWIFANSDGEGDVGEIFDKGSATFCRTDTQGTTDLDLECSLDLATTDATLNIADALTTDTWHHIVMTYTDDADDEITIYVDGKNRGSSVASGAGGPAITDGNDLLIGGSSGANFDGQIDDFRVYSYELSQTQVLKIKNNDAESRFGPATGSP